MNRLILSLLCAAPLLARPVVDSAPPPTRDFDYTTILDGNDVACFVDNAGLFGHDQTSLRGRTDGFYFPDDWPTQAKTLIYSAGIWLAGVTSQGDTLVTVADYASEFAAGAWGENPLDPPWRVWSISDDPGSWADWPVDQGAPLADNGLDPWIADLPGVTQMLWAVFNDGDAALHVNVAGSTAPLGLEARLTAWCSQAPDSETTVFLRWELLNRGSSTLAQFWAGFWVDADLGSASDDLAGCRRARQLGFVYNADDDDPVYGTQPPALGATLLTGLHVPAAGDSAFYQDAWHAGERNLPAASFTVYNNGWDPQSFRQTLFLLQGLQPSGQPRAGGPFDCPGDPLEGGDSLDAQPSDKRMLWGCGPVVLEPADRQEMSGALTAAQGGNRLESLGQLYALAPLPAGMVTALPSSGPERPMRLSIAAVRPNPFNPEATVELVLARPAASMSLTLHNLSGQVVWRCELGPRPAGSHLASLRPDNAASGVYLLRAEADGLAQTVKVLLIR